jgi:hypothetical protein
MKGTNSVPDAAGHVLFCLNFEPMTVLTHIFSFFTSTGRAFFTPVCVGLPLQKPNNRNVGTRGCKIMQVFEGK